MKKLIEEAKKPRHSSLALIFALAFALFVTYYLFIPGIVRLYKSELEEERQKLGRALNQLEMHDKELRRISNELNEMRVLGTDNNRILREIHQRVSSDRGTNRPSHP